MSYVETKLHWAMNLSMQNREVAFAVVTFSIGMGLDDWLYGVNTNIKVGKCLIIVLTLRKKYFFFVSNC